MFGIPFGAPGVVISKRLLVEFELELATVVDDDDEELLDVTEAPIDVVFWLATPLLILLLVKMAEEAGVVEIYSFNFTSCESKMAAELGNLLLLMTFALLFIEWWLVVVTGPVCKASFNGNDDKCWLGGTDDSIGVVTANTFWKRFPLHILELFVAWLTGWIEEWVVVIVGVIAAAIVVDGKFSLFTSFAWIFGGLLLFILLFVCDNEPFVILIVLLLV